MKVRWLWCLVLVGASSCWPLRLSNECQQKIDACLKRCSATAQPTPPRLPDDGATFDFRTTCERTCENLCQS